MKLCINCHTLNAPDEIFCSECGMSLINVPTDEEAVELRKAWEADHAGEARTAHTEERSSGMTANWTRLIPRALAAVWACCWAALLAVIVFRKPSYYEGTSVSDPIVVAETLVALFVVCVLAIPGWVGIAVARWRPAAGGAVLVTEGVLLLVAFILPPLVLDDLVLPLSVLGLVGALSLASGVHYVANWWKSRSSGAEGWVQKHPLFVVAIPIVLGVALGLSATYIILILMLVAVCSYTQCVF